MEKKKFKIPAFILPILIGGIFFLQFADLFELELLYQILISLGVGLLGSGIIYLLVKFKIIKPKSKELKEDEERLKKYLEGLTSDQIRTLIKTNKEIEKQGTKLIKKRKERTTKEKIWEETSGFIRSGVIVFIIAIFYLGALPVYFGVNNEFTNPTNMGLYNYPNSSVFQNVTNSYDLIGQVASYPFKIIMKIGANHATLFFWFWWATVFMSMVLPVLRIIYYLIKSRDSK